MLLNLMRMILQIFKLEMEQSDFDSITTRVRHLRENITELQKNYDQLTLNVKVNGNVQQANLDIVQTSINGVGMPNIYCGSPAVTQKEKVHQVEPQQAFQAPEPGKADFAYTSPSSKENDHQGSFQVIKPGMANHAKTKDPKVVQNKPKTWAQKWVGHQVSKPDVAEQPSTSRVKEREINLRPQKGSKKVDTNITGFKSCLWFNNTWEILLKGMKFRPEYFITDVFGKYP
ncbi:hypothetical protein ACS0TY_034391 [Phlomoides rotata]